MALANGPGQGHGQEQAVLLGEGVRICISQCLQGKADCKSLLMVPYRHLPSKVSFPSTLSPLNTLTSHLCLSSNQPGVYSKTQLKKPIIF